MTDKLILPQNTRLMGVFLGFIGGSLDVFCHIQYHSLVATQTGNILLLISDWHDSHVINTMLRFCSIIFFSLGFLFALYMKEYCKTAYWRVKMLLPLFIGTLVLPFFSRFPLLEVPFIAFGTGMMMLTFTGSLIEDHPYVIFMTSGNYRKMLIALYSHLVLKKHSRHSKIFGASLNKSVTFFFKTAQACSMGFKSGE